MKIRSVSTDDFAGWLALQTNLALKGIIGINAMSQIAKVAGKSGDASRFKVILPILWVLDN
jgi:hypothetical protein